MLKLILPTIFPSWRFFSSIGPSPRIQLAFLQHENDEPQAWQDFRPQPARLTLRQGLLRLLWNPQWNEALYINTCAEHLFADYSPMREGEIMQRLLAMLARGDISADQPMPYLVFRISAVVRQQQTISQTVTFISLPAATAGAAQ